jgi:polyhydroxybutyrate depolymerase
MHRLVPGRTGYAPLILLVALFVTGVGCDGLSGSDSPPTFNADPGWHRETLQFDDQDRSFRYYVPTTLPDDATVVMALHGATIGMNRMFPRTGNAPSSEWTTIAEEDSVLLVVPNATPQTGVVWNDCTPLPEVGGTPDDAGFLAHLTDWITDRTAVHPDRVYVYGVSNGGQMANRLAIEHPGRYAGIAAFISNINSNLGADEECPTPAEPIPVLTVSGKRDQTTPFDGGGANVWGEALLSAEATRDFWVDNNVQGDPSSPQTVEYTEDFSTVTCTRTPAPDTGADVQLCAFEGGHTIPAKPPFDFESARLAWRFFRDR